MHDCHNDTAQRLATIEGHIRAVKKMLDEDKECVDIITQLIAIERAVKKAGVTMLKSHLDSCIRESAGDEQKTLDNIAELKKLLQLYL